MTKPAFLCFRGLAAPVDLGGATDLADLARAVCPGWPIEVTSTTDTPAFFKALPDGDRYLVGPPGGPMKRVDALNAVCDIVAALPDDRGFLSRALLCLHTAAVSMGDGLVLFPNTKKAGKSTLAVALADAGHAVFTDDYLRVIRAGDGTALGVANGVLPRLRLPVPQALGDRAGPQALGDRAGPRNRQYLYAEVSALPAEGQTEALRALVFLDRNEGAAATLTEVTADEAMRAMLYQNFGRHLHSGTTLAAMAPIVEGLPRFRLTYDDPTDAAALLEARMPDLPATVARLPDALDQTILDDLPDSEPRWRVGTPARQVRDVARRDIGEGVYLADPEGRAIERLDPLAAVIWDMLEDGAAAPEITRLLGDAFPDTPPGTIADDVDRLLRKLARAGLIETP